MLPLTQIAFAFLASLLAIYTVHLFSLYRANHNPLALSHALVGLFGVGALYSLSLPFLVATEIRPLLLWSDFVAVLCLTGLFVSLGYILWFSSLQEIVRFWIVATGILAIGILALVSDVLYLQVDTSVFPAAYINPTSSLWLKSLLFVVVMVPGSFVYFRQAIHATSKRQAVRVSMLGILFLTMAITIVSENIFSRGKGNLIQGIARLAIGLVTAITFYVTRERSASKKRGSDR